MVMNLRTGLESLFGQVDNGLIQRFDLDMPEVIGLRRKLILETSRNRYIAEIGS
jgi:O-Methyltransferase involved in polyketide biosynthesis